MKNTPLTTTLERRAAALENFAEIASRPGAESSVSMHLHRDLADEITTELRTRWPHVDIGFRTVMAFGGSIEVPLETRSLTATARGVLGGSTFVEAFLAKAIEAAPLLDWATVLPTEDGKNLDFGFLSTDMTSNGVVVDGATITESDPGFDRPPLRAYAYKDVVRASAELVADAQLDLERLAAEHVAPLTARKLSTDLWGGGGTTEPQGLLAGLGTVTATNAASVSLADIARLLAAVPAADRFGSDCVVMMSPGAYDDLLDQQSNVAMTLAPATFGVYPADLTAGGGRYHGIVHGVPFVVDPALAAPATTAKSVVAGNIRQAYAVRLAPLRVDVDKANASTDTITLRVVLRADGRRMRTGAAKALVHP